MISITRFESDLAAQRISCHAVMNEGGSDAVAMYQLNQISDIARTSLDPSAALQARIAPLRYAAGFIQ